MDIRIQKTRASIYNAFIELREKKDLEKITIRELTEIAKISKQTFYLHYKDIYDLSEQIENELIRELMESLTYKNDILSHIKETTIELFSNATSKRKLFKTVFSGSRVNILITALVSNIKQLIYNEHPKLKTDLKTNIFVTVLVQGCYSAYQEYSSVNQEKVTKILGEISDSITAYYMGN